MENEFVPHDINHAAELAEFMQANEQLQDPTQRRDFLSKLDGSDFIDLTQQIASIVRTGDANAKQHFDGETVGIAGRQVPYHEDKEALIRETWNVAKDFLNDPTINDQDALDYAALTVAGGLLYAHPFADGNGRTSRSLSFMISQGSTNTEELHDVIANSAGGGRWAVGPTMLVTSPRTDFKGEQPNDIEWEDSLVGEADDAMGGIIANSLPGYGDRILRTLLEDADEGTLRHARESMTTDGAGNTVLHAETFIEKLVHDPETGMANAAKLLHIERGERAEFVRRFLRAMRTDTRWDAKSLIAGAQKRAESDPDAAAAVELELKERAEDAAMKPRDQQLLRHIGASSIRYRQHQH
jgi:hypothetical protein